MSYDYRIPQGRDKGKRTNGMFSLGGKLGLSLIHISEPTRH